MRMALQLTRVAAEGTLYSSSSEYIAVSVLVDGGREVSECALLPENNETDQIVKIKMPALIKAFAPKPGES